VPDVIVASGRFENAPVSLLQSAVLHTLAAERVVEGEVSVALLGDDEIRALNRRHLGHDFPTDVLSFALHGPGEPVVGDLYVGAEQARRQAEAEGVPEAEELVRLVVHGMLHVLGWEHPAAAEARAASPMWTLQERLVSEVMHGP